MESVWLAFDFRTHVQNGSFGVRWTASVLSDDSISFFWTLTTRFPWNNMNRPMEDGWLVIHVPSNMPSPTSLVGLGKVHRTACSVRPTPPTPIRSQNRRSICPSSPHFQSYSPTSTSFVKNLHIRICFMDPRTLGDDYKGKVNPCVLLATIFLQSFQWITRPNLRPPLVQRIQKSCE